MIFLKITKITEKHVFLYIINQIINIKKILDIVFILYYNKDNETIEV
jgi:hypothetical protein